MSEFAKRLIRLEKCNADVELQALAIAHCKRDIVTWVNHWVWTYDPRRKPSMLPMVLFPRQIEYLRWRQEVRSQGEAALCEKSRDMGLTWLNVISQTHCWLFEPDYKGAFGSRKEALVDRIGDPDSIFEKIRILLRYLPKWMLPEGYISSKHDSFCKLINPANGSTITGEAGDNIGRGGRSSVYDLDEAAFVERAQKVDAALSNNSDVIFYTSTANGMGNAFYQKRSLYDSALIFRFHWRDDPRKNDAWYEKMQRRFDPIVVASEIDIDYAASVEGIFIPAQWVLAAVDLELPQFGDRVAGLDVATEGKARSVMIWRIGPNIQSPLDWRGTNTSETAWRAHDLCLDSGVEHINFDVDGVGAGVAGVYETAGQDLLISFTPIHGSGRPSEKVWAGELRTSRDKFQNLRAEAWGLLRDRFRKTYDHVNHIQEHDWRELISIPNHPKLIQQLSSVQAKHSSTGKILLQSKEELRRLGIESPDFADALAYSELGGPPTGEFMSVGKRLGR